MIDRNLGNTAIALREGRELLAAFPRVATPAMLERLLDLGDEATGITTTQLLAFMLEQFRAGNLGARLLMGRFWRVAQDYPDLLREPDPKVPFERMRVTGSDLELLVEQAR